MSTQSFAALVSVSFFVLVGCRPADPGQDCIKAGTCVSEDFPSLVESAPSNKQKNVDIKTTIALGFDKAMDTGSVVLALTPAVNFNAPVWNMEKTSVVFTPKAPLSYATEFSAAVSGKGADGAALKEATFAFTTGSAPDIVSPTLVSSVPANGATNVASNVSLVLTFSEGISPTSLMLTTTPEYDWGTLSWNTDGTVVTFTGAPAPLLASQAYTVGIAAADQSGNMLAATTLSFTTGTPADTTAPTVMSSTPDRAATGVPLNAVPSVTFSEAVQASAAAAFSITPDAGCVATLDTTTNTVLTCYRAPSVDLAPNTAFTVTVGTGVKDLAGNSLASPYTYTFTTGAVKDTTPPTIVSVSPTQDGGYPPFSPISINFSEPMDQTATQAAFAVELPMGVTGTIAWADGGTSMSFVPNGFPQADGGIFPFVHGGNVQFRVSTGAKDLSGNNLAALKVFTSPLPKYCKTTLYPVASQSGYIFKNIAVTSPTYVFYPNTSIYAGYYAGLIFCLPGNPCGTAPRGFYRSITTYDLAPASGSCPANTIGARVNRVIASSLTSNQLLAPANVFLGTFNHMEVGGGITRYSIRSAVDVIRPPVVSAAVAENLFNAPTFCFGKCLGGIGPYSFTVSTTDSAGPRVVNTLSYLNAGLYQPIRNANPLLVLRWSMEDLEKYYQAAPPGFGTYASQYDVNGSSPALYVEYEQLP